MSNQLQYTSFPKSSYDKLGSYVYVYVDTTDNEEIVVYVGKGKENRCFAHLDSKDAKAKNIDELKKNWQS